MGVSDSCNAIVTLLCYGFALIQLFNDAMQYQQFIIPKDQFIMPKLVNKGMFISIFCESIEIWYPKLGLKYCISNISSGLTSSGKEQLKKKLYNLNNQDKR